MTTASDETAYRACKIIARTNPRWVFARPGPAERERLMGQAEAELKAEGKL